MKRDKTKALVIGSQGMLGTDLVAALHEEMRFEVTGVDQQEVDIVDTSAVFETLARIAPQIVYHCAAYTDVDGSELRKDLAFKVNGLGTWNVAAACASLDTILVYISTDYVFDGTKGEPYLETDQPNPLSVYGKSKLEGENRIRELLRRFLIVRTSGLYGKNGRNFVTAILKAAREKPALEVVDDQVCSTTYTKDLAKALVEIADTPLFGTYHLTNAGESTWYEFAKVVLGKSGVNTPVRPVTSADWGAAAPRPAFSVLANHAWKMQGRRPLRPFTSALDDYLREMGQAGR